jgi:hypothetical protein
MTTIAEFYATDPVWTVAAALVALALVFGGAVCAFYGGIELIDWWGRRAADARHRVWAAEQTAAARQAGTTDWYATMRPRPPIKVQARVMSGPVRGQVIDGVLV